MDHNQLREEAKKVVAVLNDFEQSLNKIIPEYIATRETYKGIRHRLRALRDELREEI